MKFAVVTLALLQAVRRTSGFVAPRASYGGVGDRKSVASLSLADAASDVGLEGPGKINSLIDLDSPKVVNNEAIACGKKGVYCRCWQSKTFPACDGSHMKHNMKHNDNVGPLIVSVPASEASAVVDNKGSDSDNESVSLSRDPLSLLVSLWGTGGVLLVLLEAFRRTLPSAMEPLRAASALTRLQWLAYGTAVAVFAYGQGLKCLQRKLAPLVVKRSWVLTADKGQKTVTNIIIAPLYVTGLISANKNRLIKAHSLIWGTFLLQVALQRGWVLANSGFILNIVNGGFCAGFAWGAIGLAWKYIASLMSGKTPSVDAGCI